MLQVLALVLAALMLPPVGAQAADLVVWWEKGFYPQEDGALRDVMAAFEQASGKKVELIFYQQPEFPEKLNAALETGHPPDFAFGTLVSLYIGEWAFDDRLLDLTDTVGHFSDMFDSDLLAFWTLLNQKTGRCTRCR
jgi:multiple sugar transport system substrate-binding protein